MSSEPSHSEKIREQFTATVDVFAETVRKVRMQEAERLAERATEALANTKSLLAIDVACGPGTFTRPLAKRVRRAIGADLTPAMIEKARSEADRDGITNIEFVRADVYALPFEDGAAGIASCGYAFHHMTDPERAIAEMARVVQPGGRVAITDIIVPAGTDPELQNDVERARDASHTNTLTAAQFHELFKNAGLQVRSEDFHENLHNFNFWMKNAGSAPGDPAYVQARALMEKCVNNEHSGFRVNLSDKVAGGLEFIHTVLLIVAEKPAK